LTHEPLKWTPLRNNLFLLLGSAVLYGLAFPNALIHQGLAFSGWLFAIPFFWALDGKSWQGRVSLALLWGLGAHGILLWWLFFVSPVGFSLFIFALAVQSVLFAGMFSFQPRVKYVMPFMVAAVWVVSEYLRNCLLGGFTWSLGYSQAFIPELLVSARWGGVYALSGIMMTVNAALYFLLRARWDARSSQQAVLSGAKEPRLLGRVHFGFRLVLVLSVWVVLWIVGAICIALDKPLTSSLRLGVIQPNITRAEKADIAKYDKNVMRQLALAKKIVLSDSPTVVVWPETAFPDDILRDNLWKSRIEQAARNFSADMLIGSALLSLKNRDLNAFLLVDTKGAWQNIYLKRKLVPFSEYRPTDAVSLWLMRRAGMEGQDFEAGRKPGLVTLSSGAKAGLALCSEEGYPSLFRDLAQRGAEVYIVALNDAWFVRPEALYLHAALGILRAVENGRSLVRAGNSGLSVMLNQRGVIHKERLPLQQVAYASFDTALSTGQTLYSKFGDVFVYLCGFFVIIQLVLAARRQ
jgi:apolipoprotein N-acyltransferase